MSDKRNPVVAGMFYPFDKEALLRQLEGFFSTIKKRFDCAGVVSPHAGYEYSGQTAAKAIAALKPAKNFIILGPNHSVFGSGFSIMGKGTWVTPLGPVQIDPGLAKKLKKCEVLEENSALHEHEHSIEVQLPFLQYRFKKFSFVPISIINREYSSEFMEKCQDLGKAIAGVVKNKDIRVIASSDFSHYLPLEVAKEKDRKVIQNIKKLELERFLPTLEKVKASVCGYGPILVLMTIAKKLGLKPKLIDSSSSGDATGDFGSVVTYYAIGFE